MKQQIVLGLLVWPIAAWSSEVVHQVERSSELERELGYSLVILDKHDAWRSDGLDSVFPIEGSSDEFTVRFQAPAAGKLADVWGLRLTINGPTGVLLNAPLQLKSKFNRANEVSIEFNINKAVLDGAELHVECDSPLTETRYVIRLSEYAPTDSPNQ